MKAYVKAHNEGVRTGDYGRLGELLDDGAQMLFEGLHVGPYVGKDAVLRAFREDPPGAALVIRQVDREGDTAVAVYGWEGASALFAGTIRLEARGGRIGRITVRVAGAKT